MELENWLMKENKKQKTTCKGGFFLNEDERDLN
jgi:hypothetical protein